MNVLILDDWGLDVPTAEGRRILLEILDDRYERASTIITSQFPTPAWHANLGDPTLADAILDRVLHHAYRIELRGESLRKKSRKLTPETVSLFESAPINVAMSNDNQALEVGMKFSVAEPGTITQLKYWRAEADAGDTDVRAGHLWGQDGTLLGTATFNSAPGQSGSGSCVVARSAWSSRTR